MNTTVPNLLLVFDQDDNKQTRTQDFPVDPSVGEIPGFAREIFRTTRHTIAVNETVASEDTELKSHSLLGLCNRINFIKEAVKSNYVLSSVFLSCNGIYFFQS